MEMFHLTTHLLTLTIIHLIMMTLEMSFHLMKFLFQLSHVSAVPSIIMIICSTVIAMVFMIVMALPLPSISIT